MAARLAVGLKWVVVRVIDSFMVILLANENCFGSSLAMEHHLSFRKLFKGWRTCRHFGRNLGSLRRKRHECVMNAKYHLLFLIERVSVRFLQGSTSGGSLCSI